MPEQIGTTEHFKVFSNDAKSFGLGVSLEVKYVGDTAKANLQFELSSCEAQALAEYLLQAVARHHEKIAQLQEGF